MATTIRVVPIIPSDRAKVDTKALFAGLVQAVNNTNAQGKRFIAKYPPQRLTATGYRRTGTLKRSWSAKTDVSPSRIVGLVGSNGNIAPYNITVQGSKKAKQQRELFGDAGWQGIDELVELMDDEFVDRTERVFDKELRR